jgi:hypothetical protein
MGSTVFANDEGFFHAGSGGSGKAFPDVCLSPPPTPTGPVPVPYPNKLSASDLAEGSKTVVIEGNPTALEDQSYISTSTGDEAGNQGGNVVTHKTKGKGYFTFWSLDVKVEGKGVDRNDDPMGQNCASGPPGALDLKAIVNRVKAKLRKSKKPCKRRYNRRKHRASITEDQYKKVNAKGPGGKKPRCWQCGSTSPLGNGPTGSPLPAPPGRRFTPDHKPSIVEYWYSGGCHKSKEERKKDLQRESAVRPHCEQCSDKQGGFATLSQQLRVLHMPSTA